MYSLSDERNWLTWLVKVRILILTFLLGIELAVIRLTPSPLPPWLCLLMSGTGSFLAAAGSSAVPATASVRGTSNPAARSAFS